MTSQKRAAMTAVGMRARVGRAVNAELTGHSFSLWYCTFRNLENVTINVIIYISYL
jgi:hypothetical protein